MMPDKAALQTIAEFVGKPYRWPDRTCMALNERMAELTGAPPPLGYAVFKSCATEARAVSIAMTAYRSLSAAHYAVLTAHDTVVSVYGDVPLPGDIAIVGSNPAEQISGLIGTDFMVWTLSEIGIAATHNLAAMIKILRINAGAV